MTFSELGPALISFPSAAQEARSKFEEVERSLKEMEESIRYGHQGCLCPVTVTTDSLGEAPVWLCSPCPPLPLNLLFQEFGTRDLL